LFTQTTKNKKELFAWVLPAVLKRCKIQKYIIDLKFAMLCSQAANFRSSTIMLIVQDLAATFEKIYIFAAVLA
jgi:hypothetical protein